MGEYFQQDVTIICTLWLLNRKKNHFASLTGKSMFVKAINNIFFLITEKRKTFHHFLVSWMVFISHSPSIQSLLNSSLIIHFSIRKFDISYQETFNYQIINQEEYKRDRATAFYVCSLAWQVVSCHVQIAT